MMRYFTMAVPARKPFVDYLQLHLPGLTVIWEDGSGARRTWERLMEAIGDGPAVFTEDDIVLTRDFTAKAEAAIAEHPDSLIQFHSRVKDDLTRGSRWRLGDSYYNNQAVYLPAGMARAVLDYSHTPEGVTKWDADPTAIDRVFAWYMKDKGIKYWNHVPTLAEHAAVQSALDPRRSKFRSSKTFTDPELRGFPFPDAVPTPKGA